MDIENKKKKHEGDISKREQSERVGPLEKTFFYFPSSCPHHFHR